MTAEQAYLIQRLTQARNRLLNAITGLDELTLTTETVLENWTIKDILGHVVSWGDEFRDEIKAILQDKSPDYAIRYDDDFNEWTATAKWSNHCQKEWVKF